MRRWREEDGGSKENHIRTAIIHYAPSILVFLFLASWVPYLKIPFSFRLRELRVSVVYARGQLDPMLYPQDPMPCNRALAPHSS